MKNTLFVIIIISAIRGISQCPTPITFSINPTAPTCSTCCDGSLTVTNIQNGCPGYNIQIFPSATMTSYGTFVNLCSGTTYTIKVSDNGCCGSSNMYCVMNFSSTTICTTPITFVTTTTNTSCSGCCDGSSSVSSITGGCPPYNIHWYAPAQTGTTVTGLCAGIYTASVNDAGCCPVVTNTFIITSPPPCPTPITYSIQITPPTCNGCCDGSAQVINLSGGCSTPYSAVWTPSGSSSLIANNLCSGNYSVMVNDSQGGSCCPAVTQSCNIPTTSCITFSIQVSPPTCPTCCDGSAQVVNYAGGCLPFSCVWSTTPVQYNINAVNLCSGSYSCIITDAGCCPSAVQGCFVPSNVATNINETNFVHNLIVFPNPVNSILNIIDTQNKFQNSTIEIINYLGQNVLLVPFEKQINVTSLQDGFYTIKIKNNKGLVYSNKFIKQD